MKYIELKPLNEESFHIIIFNEWLNHKSTYQRIYRIRKCDPVSAGFASWDSGQPVHFYGSSLSLGFCADKSLKLNSADLWQAAPPGSEVLYYGTKGALDAFFPDTVKIPRPDISAPYFLGGID